MALTTKLGTVRTSITVGTGGAVNVLSDRAYQSIRRASLGSRWPLRPNGFVLKSVNNKSLNILGVVRLPMSLGKGTTSLRLNFYITSDFSLHVDRLLELTTLSSHKVAIKQNKNDKTRQKWDSTTRQMFYGHGSTNEPYGSEGIDTQIGTSTLPPQAEIFPVQTSSPVFSATSDTSKSNAQGNWKQIKATVVGYHGILDRTARPCNST